MKTIAELLTILVTSSLINNVVLSQFLGLCPFLGVSKKTDTALGMGLALTFVITLSSAVCGLIYKFILIPLDLAYLQTIVFILIIAMLVQFVEMVLKKYMVSLYKALGVYLPLITTNCAVLGVALLNVQNDYNIVQGIVNGTTNFMLTKMAREGMSFHAALRIAQSISAMTASATQANASAMSSMARARASARASRPRSNSDRSFAPARRTNAGMGRRQPLQPTRYPNGAIQEWRSGASRCS